jgi:transposase
MSLPVKLRFAWFELLTVSPWAVRRAGMRLPRMVVPVARRTWIRRWRRRCVVRMIQSAHGESPWEMWRLFTLETRMESCQKEKSPGKPTTRRYSAEEKAAAVRMVRTLRAELGSEHGTIQRVAGQLGYGVESVRSWVRQADVDEGYSPGVSSTESRRIKELEQENRELQRANEILKRAASFFGAELDRQHKK